MKRDMNNKNKLIFTRNNYLEKIKNKELSSEEQKSILGLIGELSDIEKKNLINEVLNAINYNFIVTPKEIDSLIDGMANIVSEGINNVI